MKRTIFDSCTDHPRAKILIREDLKTVDSTFERIKNPTNPNPIFQER